MSHKSQRKPNGKGIIEIEQKKKDLQVTFALWAHHEKIVSSRKNSVYWKNSVLETQKDFVSIRSEVERVRTKSK